MLGVLTTVLPVFLVVGAGYAAVRVGGFAASAVDGLMTFTVRFAVPVLLFGAMYGLELSRAFDAELLASFYVGAIFCFVAGIALSRTVWRRRPGESVAVGFCALFSNTVLLGLPILRRAYDAEVLEAAFAIVALNAPVGYLLGITAMEAARRDGAGFFPTVRRAAQAMFSNALTIGIAAGLALNLGDVALPGYVMGAVELMSDAALPAALFGLGGAMTRYALRAEAGEAMMVTVLTLLVHPAVAWVLAEHVFALSDAMVRASVVLAAMPAGMNGYVFAAMYHRAEGTAAGAVLLATALSVATVAGWLWLLGGAELG